MDAASCWQLQPRMWSDETFFLFFLCTCRLSGCLSLLLLLSSSTLWHMSCLGRREPPLLTPLHFISRQQSATCPVSMRSTASLFCSPLTVTLQYFGIPIAVGDLLLPPAACAASHPGVTACQGTTTVPSFRLLPANFFSLIGDPRTPSTFSAIQLSLRSELDVA